MGGQTPGNFFRISTDILGPLGVDQLADPALAVLELVKNSWDADATRVSVRVDTRTRRTISVADNGVGMSERDFSTRWLLIGGSTKRGSRTTESGRPLIGEKGLGRLATAALGNAVEIRSRALGHDAIKANIDWNELRSQSSFDQYPVTVKPSSRSKGTTVTVHADSEQGSWTREHTAILSNHIRFLRASSVGHDFTVSVKVDGQTQNTELDNSFMSSAFTAKFRARVTKTGELAIEHASVEGRDLSRITFEQPAESTRDPRLEGAVIDLKFFTRDNRSSVAEFSNRDEFMKYAEAFCGVRVFRDGLNVPPYGLSQDDWAKLEKQRTSTGGPTLTPGNSQIFGEVLLEKKRHRHLQITAGRSGFSNKTDTDRLAHYVRWAARELARIRRAHRLNLDSGNIPSRVDNWTQLGKPAGLNVAHLRKIIAKANRETSAEQKATKEVLDTLPSLIEYLERNEEALRLFAQLASTGLAATSFAHELRTHFDVLDSNVAELTPNERPDRELVDLINSSWRQIRAFSNIFRFVPIKTRRRASTLDASEISKSIERACGLLEGLDVNIVPDIRVKGARLVPAEFDSIALNLASNAAKALSNRAKDRRLEIRIDQLEQKLTIEFTDNGPGVPADFKQRIFLPGEGLFPEGTGMGLSIIKYIAERYDGTVSLTQSVPNARTTFTVTLNAVGETNK